jgi:hypothetical protein
MGVDRRVAADRDQSNVGRFVISKFMRLALTALVALSTLTALALSASTDFVGPGS